MPIACESHNVTKKELPLFDDLFGCFSLVVKKENSKILKGTFDRFTVMVLCFPHVTRAPPGLL
jgi:hypothetical protein